MKSKNITITSKNQVTLPADLVRKLKLHKNRSLSVTERDGAIVLRPQPSLQQRMQKYWDEFHAKNPGDRKPISDEQIHTEVKDAYKQYFEAQP